MLDKSCMLKFDLLCLHDGYVDVEQGISHSPNPIPPPPPPLPMKSMMAWSVGFSRRWISLRDQVPGIIIIET